MPNVVEYSALPEDDLKAFVFGLRRGLRVAAEFWQKTLAPKHFQRGATQKYGYKERDAEYNAKKLRLFHHRTPLVLTGTSKSWVLGRRAPATTRKMGDRIVGRLPIVTPDYFYKFRPEDNEPDKAEELVTTVDNEANQMEEFIRGAIDREVAKPKRRFKKAL